MTLNLALDVGASSASYYRYILPLRTVPQHPINMMDGWASKTMQTTSFNSFPMSTFSHTNYTHKTEHLLL
jgi:hypothetical protein